MNFGPQTITKKDLCVHFPSANATFCLFASLRSIIVVVPMPQNDSNGIASAASVAICR